MIIVTGASGFIGSALVSELNRQGLAREVVVVDDFYKHHKEVNLKGKIVREWVHRDIFLNFLPKIAQSIDFIFHLGARTDTFEDDKAIFQKLNINYSQDLWKFSSKYNIPFYYASSAATYGDGSNGFEDDHKKLASIKPLNEYARSKHNFDLWLLKQNQKPDHWAGFKFFNIYGPNEYHKGSMASVIFHAYHQIRQTKEFRLFKSYKPEYKKWRTNA